MSEVIQLYSYDYYDHAASAGTGQYLNDVRVERIELPVDTDARLCHSDQRGLHGARLSTMGDLVIYPDPVWT